MNEIVVSSERHFSRAILGLNKTEVYSYLNEVSSAYEELQLQIQVLKDQNNKLADSNRENALKLYNLQNDITEAQKKTDRANVELEAAKKENAALRRELDAAEKRISKLTDDLIKTGADIAVAEKPKTEEPKVEETKGFTPKPIFDTEEKKTEEPKAEEPVKEEPKDIFAELKDLAAKEKEAKQEAAAETVDNTASSVDVIDEDEVYAGEVEIVVDESMLIGNDDDDDEGFTFL
ncbi:MAG: DivIVA domain-containing protein [Lachnospiraceae bacterium]|nr:DivIVA domain-containing protein [Lachnospiraceae bacterium]